MTPTARRGSRPTACVELGDAAQTLALRTHTIPTTTTTTIARTLGVSPRVVNRAVLLTARMPLSRYLGLQRVITARSLMSNVHPGSISLGALARRAGFDDRRALDRAFTRHVHDSAYRTWLRVAPAPSEPA